jgi:hypothetical protein
MDQPTSNDIISQINLKLEHYFGFSYVPIDSSKDLQYYNTTLNFLNNNDYMKDVIKLIENISILHNRFLLIDGENIFFNFTSSAVDRSVISDILDNYLERGIYIIIFCQEHSVKDITGITTSGRFRNIGGMLKNKKNVFVFCSTNDNKGKKVNLFPSIDFAPPIPDKSEIDDMLLVYCFKTLKDKNKEVYIRSNDDMNWLNMYDIDLKQKLQDARILSSDDIEKKSSKQINITRIGRIGPNRNERFKNSRFKNSRFKPYTSKIKGKNKEKQRTRTKPNSKPKKQRTRIKLKPKKQRTRTKPKPKKQLRNK